MSDNYGWIVLERYIEKQKKSTPPIDKRRYIPCIIPRKYIRNEINDRIKGWNTYS